MDRISEALGAAHSIREVKESVNREVAVITDSMGVVVTQPTEQNVEFNKDVTYAKDNIRRLIDNTMDAIPEMIDLLSESQSPMMYNAASAFVKTIAELNKTLIEVSKKGAEPAEGQTPATTNITQNNITYSNTTDMMRDL